MKIDVFKAGYVTDEVSTIDPSAANLNEENRIKFVTDLAAISRGKHESNNPAVRYKQLLKEAAPNTFTRSCPNCKSINIGSAISKVDNSNRMYCEECIYTDEPDSVVWFKNQKGTPSRPLQFLPVVLNVKLSVFNASIGTEDVGYYTMDTLEFLNKLSKYSYIEYAMTNDPDDYHQVLELKAYTNMRACLNAGIPYDNIPYNTTEDMKNFKALRIKAPMFVFNHLVTHTALSKEARSERVTELNPTNYWLPDDFRERVYSYVEMRSTMNWDETVAKYGGNEYHLTVAGSALKTAKYILTLNNIDDVILSLLSFHHSYDISENSKFLPLHLGQTEVQGFFKELGYKEEIYQRAMLEFRYKEFIMTGWDNDPTTWMHLCIERSTMPGVWKNWTQPETVEVVSAIKKIIFPNL